MHSRTRLAAVLAVAVALPACLEADVRNELRADGSGSMGMSMKFTDKTVEIIRKLEKIDPKQSKQMSAGMMKKPDEKLIAEWEKRGLKVGEFEAVNDEKQISARFKIEYANLAALACLEDLEAGKGGGPGNSFTLTRDDKGIYTFATDMDDSGKGESGAAPGGAGEDDEEKEEEKPDAEDAAKKSAEAMAIMGEMMGEASKLKFTVCLKVPGEVVDFSPEVGSKKEEGSVTWTMDFGAMMQMQMSGAMMQEEEEGGGGMKFKVRFKMPEGKSLPESALTPVKAKTPPPAPPKAPEGGMDPK